MTVCVLAMPGEIRRARADAVLAAGSAVYLLTPDGPLDLPVDASVLLAGDEAPVDVVRAFFATPAGQAGRKILVCGADPATARALAPDTDMLVFDAAGFAALLDLPAAPDDGADLLGVRTMLTRPNQAVVVRLGAGRAAAVWAETMMRVDGKAGSSAMSGFSGTIAAAVARRIGPEPALVMALAA